jgi:hypothetical protein
VVSCKVSFAVSFAVRFMMDSPEKRKEKLKNEN